MVFTLEDSAAQETLMKKLKSSFGEQSIALTCHHHIVSVNEIESLESNSRRCKGGGSYYFL